MANPWPDMRVDLGQHQRNRALVPLEYLQRFLNQQVAWHADGTRIVAAAETDAELLAELARLGIDAQDVVFGYVGDADLGVF